MRLTLDQVPVGQRVRIVEIGGADLALQQRVREMGLMEDDEVAVVFVAPMGDPIAVRRGDLKLSLRRREAASIEVVSA